MQCISDGWKIHDEVRSNKGLDGGYAIMLRLYGVLYGVEVEGEGKS